MPGARKLAAVAADIVACRDCPRLVAWRERVAREKRAKYRDQDYWGRPVPGFGDPNARLVIVGLAPGAHGANRTGRIFTGDASGDFLYAALHRAGFASQAESTARDDGLRLRDCFITCAARCAPPDNAPTPEELQRCSRFLDEELHILRSARVVLALGAIAWTATLSHFARDGVSAPGVARPRAKFSHDAEIRVNSSNTRALTLLGSYHVSQQNTATGKLTSAMFDAVLGRAHALIS